MLHVTAEPHEDNAIAAPRGDILDANGEPLVTSRPAFCVYYRYTDKTQAEAVPRLAAILGTDMADAEKRVSCNIKVATRAHPNRKDITPEQYTAIVEDAPNLTGVFIEAEPIRFYPNNEVMSPILGYVGEISEWQLQDARYSDYDVGDIIGQQGLESYYEDVLRGKDGGYKVEVDYLMRPTGNKGPGIDPVPGSDVRLNIDLSIQKAAEEALRVAMDKHPSAKGGAAVVLDVKTGGVIAMVSAPGFDPNRLVTGISQRELNFLVSSGQWMFSDLASTGLYPPGSTFKIVTAIAALQEGAVTADERVFDPGYHPMVPSLPCQRGGHGA